MVLFKVLVTSLLVKTLGFGVGLVLVWLELENGGFCSSRPGLAPHVAHHATRLCCYLWLAPREDLLASRVRGLSGNFVLS